MTSIYEIHKANRIGRANDFWTALVAQKWKASEEEFKEYTGSVPVTINADGSPILNYKVSGNMTQTGTPTPETPIAPSECGDRTRNLFDKDNVVFSGFYPHSDTGAVANTTSGKLLSIIVPCEPNTSYTWSFDKIVADLRNRVAGYAEYPSTGMSCEFLDRETDSPSGSTRTVQKFTTTANTHWLILMVTGTGQTAETLTEDVAENAQLEIGTEMTPYEPYGYKIPISSASTTTPVYLGEVESTRQIYKIVFDGTENLTKDTDSGAGARYYYRVPESAYKGLNQLYVLCTHYTVSETFTLNTCRLYLGTRTNIYITVDKNDYPTIEDYQAYLAQQYAAGTPVTVWYVLSSATTGIVNEPLMKIGDYTDTVSMEQAGVQIPTNRGNTVIDVLTELKPSEMYIKYQG